MQEMSTSTTRKEAVPFSQVYIDRINAIRNQRVVRDQRLQNDLIETRNSGDSFRVQFSDSSQLYPSDRNFGYARPLSAGRGRRSMSSGVPPKVDTNRRSRSVTKSPSRSRSRSTSCDTSFRQSLHISRNLAAEEKQRQEIVASKKALYKSFLTSSKPWVPTSKATKSFEANHKEELVAQALRAVDKKATEIAWRRTPWPAYIPPPDYASDEQATTSSSWQSEVESNVSKFGYALGPPPVRESLDEHSTVVSGGTRSTELQVAKSRKIVLERNASKYLALTVRLVNHSSDESGSAQSACLDHFGILVLQRMCSLHALVSSIERQFGVAGQVSDVCIIRAKPYSREVVVGSLALNTLQDPPAVNEECDITVYLNGAIHPADGTDIRLQVEGGETGRFSKEGLSIPAPSPMITEVASPIISNSERLTAADLEQEILCLDKSLRDMRRNKHFLDKISHDVAAFDAFATSAMHSNRNHPSYADVLTPGTRALSGRRIRAETESSSSGLVSSHSKVSPGRPMTQTYAYSEPSGRNVDVYCQSVGASPVENVLPESDIDHSAIMRLNEASEAICAESPTSRPKSNDLVEHAQVSADVPQAFNEGAVREDDSCEQLELQFINAQSIPGRVLANSNKLRMSPRNQRLVAISPKVQASVEKHVTRMQAFRGESRNAIDQPTRSSIREVFVDLQQLLQQVS